MAKYRKKPIVVDAIQWDGTNDGEIGGFIFGDKNGMYIESKEDKIVMKISTLEGIMDASVNDYIIKGVNGEFYPCKPDIFEKTYTKE